MATSTIKIQRKDAIPLVALNSSSSDIYSDSAVLTLLRNNNRIKASELCYATANFAGGERQIACYLYSNGKAYGWVMVFHYNSNPRFFTVNEDIITVRQFATS